MKFLNVNQHLSELDEHIKVLKSYGDVFEAVEARIMRVINMDGAFKGEGAKGVIYNHAHMQLPTIRSIRAFLISFSETLEKMKANINEYEPASNGSVSEDFWKNQLPKGYDRYEETLEEREAAINQATAEVSHILHLGKLQTGDVYNSVDSARKHADDVLEGLYDLDQAGVELMAQVRTKMEELKATIRQVLDWTVTGGVTMKGVSIMEVGGYFANNATLHEKAPEVSVKLSTPNPLIQYANNFPLHFKYDTMHSIMKVFDLSHHHKWFSDRIKSLPLTSLFNVARASPVREQSIWAYANAHYSGDKETVERAAEAIREIREREEAHDPLRTFSFLLDFAPFIGNAKAAQEASLGVDLITGQELDEWDRGIAAASIFLGGIGKVGGRTLKNIVKGSDNFAGATRISNRVEYGDHYTRVDRKKVLKSNVEYMTPEGYLYKTDGHGRITHVEGDLSLGAAKRNNYAQRNVEGKNPGDDGGHLIASIFKGSGDIDNLVPMNANLNRGAYKRLEYQWRKALEEVPPKEVKVKVQPVYQGSSQRPIGFEIEYKIGDGPWNFHDLPNP
ncbi:ribonuclease YeeF family protein [Halalkalibacterium halodurans]|uniref:ribonuclease YeeF family protein n=1 Tax=Halalkalibacterium halodurans TaxID=86665 RepID=UPI002E1F61CC|nr:ribonuclease YeeF family protein [Halalkalibacterium halodurans]MED4085054.1 ribonuclease YeeF family protein [Halalkalibacterium halodurans]MED4105927.1 ribonuclease YeeF family protein [Halalkalibacterium halodurans]MED4111130.1 ribonuclease YeeF family protein [Halalkalibacterium halodurans]MED4148109.1 ribonuclease YeeF family protein [Halalkalibacterium halodurans]